MGHTRNVSGEARVLFLWATAAWHVGHGSTMAGVVAHVCVCIVRLVNRDDMIIIFVKKIQMCRFYEIFYTLHR